MNTARAFDICTSPLDGINLIEASAGTGKTWTLCGLYLRLLLERRLCVQQILVVTFTNAATAELRGRMRTRISETLAYLDTGMSHDPFIPRLIGILEDAHGIATDDMRKRLELALQSFDEAAIFTIHAFCFRALGDLAFSSGLPFSLELVQDDARLRMEAVHDFWRRRISGTPMSSELAAWLVQKKDQPQKFAALLKRHMAKPLALCKWPEDFEHDSVSSTAELRLFYDHARATWEVSSNEIRELLLASLDRLNATSYKGEFVRGACDEWEVFFGGGDPLAVVNAKTSRLKLLRLAWLTHCTKNKNLTPVHPFFDQAEALLAAREAVENQLTRARLRLIRTLLDETGTALRQRKREQRIVSYDDILHNLYAALTSGLHSGLANALRMRFPAALIDEFQDTDPLQFAVFQKIYGDGTAPLFLVGDPKQAIFSFRNADLHTYLHAKKTASAAYTLAENQRSTQGLITAINGLFSANSQTFMQAGLDYHAVTLGAKPRPPFVDHTTTTACLQIWTLPETNGKPVERSQAKQLAAHATTAEIARLIMAGRAGTIILNDRQLCPGDIAVLVRTHAEGSLIKLALTALNIGSVELAQTSVFHSSDAEEVERVLLAILQPARAELLRAALATEMLGCDASEIAALAHDENQLALHIERFTRYRETWQRRGAGVMFRQLLSSEAVSARMLARADGERRLTNLLHLAEQLHEATETHTAPDALLRWLQARRREDLADEAAQLRLESDQNLVQIITIHKAKGLEFPLVFCPFLWIANGVHGGLKPEGHEYHDDENQVVVDFRTHAKPEKADIEQRKKLANSAESLRLMYVALTRAIYRCYLIAGCYESKNGNNISSTGSTRSLLNWLVAGNGQTPEEWFEGKPGLSSIAESWATLAQRCSPHMSVMPLPSLSGTPVSRELTLPHTLVALIPPILQSGWRISSFSGLQHGAVSETAASDHDTRIAQLPRAELHDIHADDILRFPRGPAAGNCLHTLLESIDFTDARGWDAAIQRALRAYPQTLPGLPPAEQQARLARMMMRMLGDMLNTPLPQGILLRAISLTQRLTELEFNMPAPQLSAGELNQLLKSLNYPTPRLHFAPLEGYLKGFIDLVFEHDGRYFVLDWKSNYLGESPAHFAVAPLTAAMEEHGYHLQYLLYSVALHRYLQHRIADYDYTTHFGGVLYLFIRGVRPRWKAADGMSTGVYFHCPDKVAVNRIDALLGGDSG